MAFFLSLLYFILIDSKLIVERFELSSLKMLSFTPLLSLLLLMVLLLFRCRSRVGAFRFFVIFCKLLFIKFDFEPDLLFKIFKDGDFSFILPLEEIGFCISLILFRLCGAVSDEGEENDESMNDEKDEFSSDGSKETVVS